MKLVSVHNLLVLLGLIWFGSMPQILPGQTMDLEDCLEAALTHNRDLQMAQNALYIGEIQVEEARANRWPRVSLTADYRYFTNLPYQLLPLSVFNGPEGQFKEAQFGVPHNLGISAQLALPIYQPTLRPGIQMAETAAELGQLQVEKGEEQLLFEVTTLYYNAQIVQHQILFADSNLANTDKLLAAMLLLREQGLARGTDLERIELQRAQLMAQRTQLESNLNQALNGLNFLMGRNLDEALSIPLDINSADLENDPAAPSVEEKMAEVQYQLLTNELHQLKRSRLPAVSAVANYGLTGFGYFEQPDPFFDVFPNGFIGLQASYPIWNKSTRSKIARKEWEMINQNLRIEQIQARSEWQIANALSQKNTAEGNIAIASGQIALARSIFEQTLIQNKQGTATITDIILADNAQREAQAQYLQALIVYLKADLELKKSSGSIHNLKP